jgi:N-methylhydantoinase B/oxoprolinase/acetone carboxylase alpha subunit
MALGMSSRKTGKHREGARRKRRGAPRINIDAIEFEVFKNLYLSIAEEMGATLQRTGFSPNIKERLDYSCAVYDARGETIAQGDHMPVHLGAMPLSVRAAIEAMPMDRGDVVMLNDPFRGGTHLPDITFVSPVFLDRGGRPAFYVANRAHHSDVGGMSPGSMPVAREIYQEGLIIPPVRIVRRRRIVRDVLALLLANVRTPEEREGDLTAQIAANRVAESRLQHTVSRYGRGRTLAAGAALQDYTERVMRAAIAAIPDGEYTFGDALDDDGVGSGPIVIRASVRIAGERATIDFSGSSPQVSGSVNANYAITLSACVYVFRCLIEDDVLYNAGIARPLTVIAPEGTIVNARRPAAVAGGNVETSQRITDVVLGALSGALPSRIPAASQGTMNNVTFGGVDPSTGQRFAYYETIGGGMGGRAGLPGLSGVHTHMSNTRNTPIEAIERYLPIRVREYRLRRGSGGIGAAAGGDGLVREYEALTEMSATVLSDRRVHPPYGAQGGEPGACGRNVLIRDGAERELPGKIEIRLRPGDRLRIETPGGGGYGKVPDSKRPRSKPLLHPDEA